MFRLLLIGALFSIQLSRAAAEEASGFATSVWSPEISIGDPKAPWAVIEFTDYTCPYCSHFTKSTFFELVQELVSTSKVYFITKTVPLDEHLHALTAAIGARCAHRFGVYFEYRSMAASKAPIITRETILLFATDHKIDPDILASCLDEDTHSASLSYNAALASTHSLSGIPSFLIVSSEEYNKPVARIIGAQKLSVFLDTIDNLSK